MVIEDLHLTLGAYNALKRAGIDTVEQIAEMTPSQLADIRGLGEMLLMDIVCKVRGSGYDWAREVDCETCANSKMTITHCGPHRICCLFSRQAVDCICTGKHYKRRTE